MSGVRVIAAGSTFMANGAVLTNGAGEFRFPSLASGSYILMASPSEGPPAPAARARRENRTDPKSAWRHLLPLGSRCGGGNPTGGCARSGIAGHYDRRSESTPVPRPGNGRDLVGKHIARGRKALVDAADASHGRGPRIIRQYSGAGRFL